MKTFFVICVLFFLSSCSQDLIYSETAPSWVNDVRSGKGSLRVNNGDKVLFRSNQKGTEQEKRENVCTNAIQKNISYIKKAYPFSVQIPMTIELVFFDPEMNDCSTTISVSRQLMEKAEALSGLNGQYEKEKKRLKTETKKVQTDLNKVNIEKQNLEKEIEELNKLMEENRGYERQIKTLEDFIESAKDERRQVKKKVENYIYTGMNQKEVAKIMKGHRSEFIAFSEKCGSWRTVNKLKAERFFDYLLCFSVSGIEDSLNPKGCFVEKICNLKENHCYTRSLDY